MKDWLNLDVNKLSECNHELDVALFSLAENGAHVQTYFLQFLQVLFMGIDVELVPEIGVVLLLPLRQLHIIDQRRPEIKFQFLEFLVKLPSHFIFDFRVELIALDHLRLSFIDNILKDFLHLFLLLFRFDRGGFYIVMIGLVLCFSHSLLLGFVGVEEGQQFWKFVDIDGAEKSTVVVFQLFLPLFDELGVSITEQLSRREHGEIIFPFSLLAVFVDHAHSAVSFLEGPRLVLPGVENLTRPISYVDGIPYSSVVVVCTGKFYHVFGLFDHSLPTNYKYIRIQISLNRMSSNNSLDLSIQLEENEQKSKQQELDEFVELTKKIEESDRNNDLLREIKKNKLSEVGKIKAAQREVLDERDSMQSEYESLLESIREVKSVGKLKVEALEELSKKQRQLTVKQKQAEEKSMNINKENDKLEKKIMSLQTEYEQVLRTNKEKSAYLQKLKKKKEQQDELLQENERKIEDLENMCENTKVKAEQTEQALSKQLKINAALEKEVAEKEKELELMRKERIEASKKQEETKKLTNKLKEKAKNLEKEVDQKYEQLARLQKVRIKLEKEGERIQKTQKAFEQMVAKRAQIIEHLKQDQLKARRERVPIKDLKPKPV